jgi:hypothetical protein
VVTELVDRSRSPNQATRIKANSPGVRMLPGMIDRGAVAIRTAGADFLFVGNVVENIDAGNVLGYRFAATITDRSPAFRAVSLGTRTSSVGVPRLFP